MQYATTLEEVLALRSEVARLRERLGPRGLEVVEIDGAGHYVNETVKAEIERLRSGAEQRQDMAGAIERIILRRFRENQIDGYTKPMSDEIASLFPAPEAKRS